MSVSKPSGGLYNVGVVLFTWKYFMPSSVRSATDFHALRHEKLNALLAETFHSLETALYFFAIIL